ncbi:MAG: UDP-2,3-diacylglucosamine diphosphatase LpxI [Pseudomonadota bacterium]
MAAPIGLIAGAGRLPELVAASVEAAARKAVVIRLAGMADPALERFEGREIQLGALRDVIATLRAQGCVDLSFAGKVERPDFSSLGLDDLAMTHMPRLMPAASRGDDALMRAVGDIFEAEGFNIVGLSDVADDLICREGVVAGGERAKLHSNDMAKAFDVAGLVGEHDIGQGCIVCAGLVLAVEAQEGTNAMLSRVKFLSEDVRGTPDRRRGVLVKRAKPGQDLRMDLPVVGLETFEHAAAAGLAGIGLEAHTSIIVDKDELIQRANEIGMAIVGLGADGRIP